MDLAELLGGVLAVWRVTHLLRAEDGPWRLGFRLRRAAGRSLLGELLDCFYCLSLWVAVPLAVAFADGWREGVVLWLALSGGAIVVQRLLPAEPAWEEDP